MSDGDPSTDHAPKLEPHDDWSIFPSIAQARAWSLDRVAEIERQLARMDQEFPEVRSVVLAGSLARLDAGDLSDLDLIVVVQEESLANDASLQRATHQIGERLRGLGLRSAQPEGIFAKPTTTSQLCDGPRGVVAEAIEPFGKRMQLLLEARPVMGNEACRQLQRDILLRFARHPFADRRGERWSYLLDDLIRYWRSYRVWRHWDTAPGNGGWYLRNAKLRHSRLLSYASLLAACSACQRRGQGVEDAVESLLQLVAMSPLDRFRVMAGDYQANTQVMSICARYDQFLTRVHDTQQRYEWEQWTSAKVESALAEAPAGFVELLENGDELARAIWQLLLRIGSAGDGMDIGRLVL